jgi:hypothetical protein
MVAQEIVRARIGIRIKSADQTAWAEEKRRVKTGDLLRLYVVPEKSSYVYFVYDDNKTAILLNIEQHKKKFDQGTTIVSPSGNRFYKIEGSSERESFTIICSRNEMVEVSSLLNSTYIPHSKWIILEGELIEKSKIDMNQKIDKPFPITGSVRDLGEGVNDDSFLKGLEIVFGRSFLIKKYEFTIAK